MTEELFTVQFDWDKNFNGRDENGRIRMARAGGGVLMDRTTAEALCRVLRPKFPTVRPVQIWREDRDDLVAHSLADLNEGADLSDLTEVVEQLVAQGFDREDILRKCNEVLDSLAV